MHRRDRFDYWHQVACEYIVDHHSAAEGPQDFSAALDHGRLADVDLLTFENSAMRVSHTRHHAMRADTSQLFLCRQFEGSLFLEQNGSEAFLKPGDFTLIDPRYPYRGKFSNDSKLLILKLPRASLASRAGSPERMLARAVRAAGDDRFTSALIGMLPLHAGELSQTAETLIRNQLLDLIALSLSTVLDRAAPGASAALSLLNMKIHTYVEMRLGDPRLDAKAVAAALSVSVRYLNAALALEQTSIARLIYARRLARCRLALEDPAQRDRSISDIAYGWGFSDMTHFARKFRAAYGCLPSGHRQLFK
jgi:AraC-like DNA-binding protein